MGDSSMESCQAVKLTIQIHLSAEVKRVRGVFKKREILLNISPTSTESGLGLLSAPSVRFKNKLQFIPFSYEH
jgi:hypothetical protein